MKRLNWCFIAALITAIVIWYGAFRVSAEILVWFATRK